MFELARGHVRFMSFDTTQRSEAVNSVFAETVKKNTTLLQVVSV
jgi:hypothetical protein